MTLTSRADARMDVEGCTDGLMNEHTVKFLNIQTPEQIAVIILKF